MQRKIYITGFMGAGKTTVGQALAKELQADVVDVDQWIEETEQKAITTIFAEKGEAYFRELETKALKAIDGERLIVTTGGGLVIKDENRQLMEKQGIVVYLQCEIDEVLRRLEGDVTRPNLRGSAEEIAQLFESRRRFYEEASITINTTKKTIEQIVDELLVMLK